MDGFREEKEMKKLYKKPVLYMEKFAVDKNFASGCAAGSEYTFGSEYTCSWNGFFHSSCGLDPSTLTPGDNCYGFFGQGSPFAS